VDRIREHHRGERLAVELRPGLELVSPAGSDDAHDSDGDIAGVSSAGYAERRRIGSQRWYFSDARHLEVPKHSIAVGDDANISWNRNLDVRHDAENLDLGSSGTNACVREVELDVPHERECPKDARQDPFTFALDARPPDGDPVALGDEIVRDDSDDAIVQR